MRLLRPTRLAVAAASLALVAGIGAASAAPAAPAAGIKRTATVDPLKTLVGASTGLNGPGGIAFDSSGRMYVSNAVANSITVYAKNWVNGNTAPIKTLKGAATGLSYPGGIAIDAAGQLYVANSGVNLSTLAMGTPSVTVYASNWASGNTAPVKTLKGAATGLNQPSGLALDRAGNLSVINVGLNFQAQTAVPSITTYAAGWKSGNTAPTRTIKGAATQLGLSLGGIAYDIRGQLYVANTLGSIDFTKSASITVYAANASGNAAPVKQLVGPATRIIGPVGVMFDAAGRMLVTDAASQSVNVYHPSWATGDTAPTAILNTASTPAPGGLQAPAGIAADSTGTLYVTNLNLQGNVTPSVVALAGLGVPPMAPTNLKAMRTTAGVTVQGDMRGPNIRLTWTASVARNTPVTGYLAVCTKGDRTLRATVGATATSVILVGAGAGPFTCSVSATSAYGRSAPAIVRNV